MLQASRPARQIALWTAVIVAAWTLYALLATNIIYYNLSHDGSRMPPWSGLFRWNLQEMSIWAAATPIILLIARRFPVRGRRWPVHLAAHLAGAYAVHATAELILFYWRKTGPHASSIPDAFIQGTITDAIRYGIVAAIVHAHDGQEAARRRHEEALRLQSQLAEARLQALTMQLQPHFLFNALHAISELTYRDPALADRAISRLADMLRMALANSGQLEGTLEEELAFVSAWVELESLRLGDRFALTLDVPAEVRGLAVPILILQPLVENAFRHGLHGVLEGRVNVAAWHRNGTLHLRVADNGRGVPPEATEGIGLRNTRERLESIYGSAQQLRLTSRPGGGTEVELEIPARTVQAERSGAPLEVAG